MWVTLSHQLSRLEIYSNVNADTLICHVLYLTSQTYLFVSYVFIVIFIVVVLSSQLQRYAQFTSTVLECVEQDHFLLIFLN
jgi:hypothetical protein